MDRIGQNMIKAPDLLHVKHKGADQPTHSRSLIRAFGRHLESIVEMQHAKLLEPGVLPHGFKTNSH